MICDFEIESVLRLSAITRFGIIEMSREQSVAEHSFNVSMIALDLLNGIIVDEPNQIRLELLEWALCHDLPELVTGDMPTPFKRKLASAIEAYETSEYPRWTALEGNTTMIAFKLVKVADFIDAIVYARKYCVDSRKDEIIYEMVAKLGELADQISLVHGHDLFNKLRSIKGVIF